ncbi:GFA family protein [Sneathiella sp.]|uniref:GFA family protein n=1 Tax=Sneathiella sp. TaxID=1964365 RepID=UPI002626B944|nr:GFA family protein [Sneathiella sp.]MDF2368792.1 GFA family protein [Sneathiella sp.]
MSDGGDKKLHAKGGCLCGGIRFEIYQPLRPVVVCHCKQCRQTAGYLNGFTVALPENLVFIKDDTLTWFESSVEAKRGFCNTCGSSIFWTEKKGGNMGIAPASLDEPTGLETARHIFTEFAGDYYEITDGLPQYLQGTPPHVILDST